MSNHKAAMTDEEIESMAWQLESKMMEIRQDPRAALTAGLTKVRATLIAEMRADLDKLRTKTEAAMAQIEAEYAAQYAAQLRAKMEAVEAKLDAKLADLTAQFCAAARAKLEPLGGH